MTDDWNDIEEFGHRVVALVVVFAIGFVTCLLTVCAKC